MEKSRRLEVTVVSGEELKVAGRFISKNAYVVVRSDPLNSTSTDLDRSGGSYPYWNQKVDLLPLSPEVQSFEVEVRCKTKTRDVSVGTVKVPLTDIVEDYVPAALVHFLSYRLRERNGEQNGIINLAVKLVDHPSIIKPQMKPVPMKNEEIVADDPDANEENVADDADADGNEDDDEENVTAGKNGREE